MVLVPAAAFFELLMLLMLSIVALMFFRWLVHALVGWIPFIGNRAEAAADAVSVFVQSKTEDWLEPQLHVLLTWLATFASRVLDYPKAAFEALAHVDDAVRLLVESKIGQLISVATKQLRLDVSWLKLHVGAAESAIADVPSLIEHRLDVFGSALSRALRGEFDKGIDTLNRDVVQPGLHDARAVAGHAVDVAGRVRGDLEALRRELDIPLGVLEALVAAVGAVAALEALTTLATCRGKLKTLCTSDPHRWEQFIAGLVAVGLLFSLEELAAIARPIVHELEPIIRQAA